MARFEDIKSLIKAHVNMEHDRFVAISKQIAAHEKHVGRSENSTHIHELLSKGNKGNHPKNDNIEIFTRFNRKHLYQNTDVLESIELILLEDMRKEALREMGLNNRTKILLSGPPGTGKTLTASLLAKDLNLPLYVVMLDRVLRSYMGQTGAELRKIFDIMRSYPGVYFFDEFDSIAAVRGIGDDVGEIRRVTNMLLQHLEMEYPNAFILAATNTLHFLDKALFRRFDDIITYSLPTRDIIRDIVVDTIVNIQDQDVATEVVVDACAGLSQAEIIEACLEARKMVVLFNHKRVDEDLLLSVIEKKQKSPGS